MLVAQITAEKAEEIKGTEYQPFSKYNPFQYGNDVEWYVTLKESEFLNENDFVVTEITVIYNEENE